MKPSSMKRNNDAAFDQENRLVVKFSDIISKKFDTKLLQSNIDVEAMRRDMDATRFVEPFEPDDSKVLDLRSDSVRSDRSDFISLEQMRADVEKLQKDGIADHRFESYKGDFDGDSLPVIDYDGELAPGVVKLHRVVVKNTDDNTPRGSEFDNVVSDNIPVGPTGPSTPDA